MPVLPSFAPAAVAGLPSGLHVVGRPPPDGWSASRRPVVVLVHGSLDRAASFTRTLRRLPEDWGVVAYDRRGYQGSRGGPPVGLAGHVEDLLGVARALTGPGRPLTAVGHSMGGVIVMGAAVAEPGLFSSIGVYEPPAHWLPVPGQEAATTLAPLLPDPGRQAEWFFRQLMGDDAWERLPAAARASRLADGPALRAELASVQEGTPYDVTALAIPALFGCGGAASGPSRQHRAAWLADHVADGHLQQIAGAGHGAHLSHPTAFAEFVRAAVDLGDPAGRPARRTSTRGRG